MPTFNDPPEVIEDKRRTRQMMVEAIRSGMTEDMVAHAEAAIKEGRRKAEEQKLGSSDGPSQADLEYTAKKYNMTVEQVKEKLGIK